jgi:16S rRNA G1207 methylase RsmC
MNASASLELLHGKVRGRTAIVLGSPREAAEIVAAVGAGPCTCYQMDLYQADRLRDELAEQGLSTNLVVAADLWDLPADFETVVYPTPRAGERGLKIDMVEQAFHILRPGGALFLLSPYSRDQLFPALLKKVFGRVHAAPTDSGTLFWAHRNGDRPRRRHEITFHARIGDAPSLSFLSRPGVFSYGRLDDGARALLETMEIHPSERILDLGCGSGANGIFAAKLAGPTGSVTFVDSNVRAVAVAEHNARDNSVAHFEAVACADMSGLHEGAFDVCLANPPYYAQLSIARLFIERSRALLRPRGRLYLVTKQADQLGPLVAERFGRTDAVPRRGYVVLCAPGG